MKKLKLLTLVALLIALPSLALAEEEAVSEMTYILNTFSFLISGVLVMWMAAGFAMLEAGLVRSKNVATICLKNIALFGVAGILFYLIGYNLMYMNVDGGFMGSFAVWGADDAAALAGDYSAGYSAGSDWFFQMVFCGAACSVVSGCVAERIKLWSFLLFCVVLTGIIYPIQGSWGWGGGWLSAMGFSDYAGSTLVHSCGGWAALTGAIILGARKGKYSSDGRVNPIPGSNIPMATIGTFILWMGWFGFNGGSALALGVASSAIEQGAVYINTNLAACGGMIAAMIAVQIMYKKTDVTMALNGALAGLVSITAGPAAPSPGAAILIGAVGGVLVVLAVPFFDKLKIDDVVGALSVHLVCGIWGTLAVPFCDDGTSFLTQLIGVVSIGAFVVVTSSIVWLAIKFTIGVRCDEEDEYRGLDIAEIGVEAYPDFQAVTNKR
ncbi:ammonium transporter [Desulfuromonas acetoxidans]|uniref:Ammonium transporter n=1 Tax=Desulfuromonas acetoxidans (strain DSM 684 / 11070) TaxID=281689 RepID=Q1K0H9_DESA6|nr:ammonium transporter [Desulfuromonas acetoxidans]EAT15962.1 ammonium transporter [Desulfuromonas acetoxidans DSM 684]MBF0644140.1 ammonium transporter [Desulfuromonas acetoxidans]NVD24562.1 ammonium transporter [Desulfuromonas acetoxidans]NVE16488.1 ammonium transporter [Desulfuromonas acetoxidans]